MNHGKKTRKPEKSGEGERPALKIGEAQDKKKDEEGKSKRGDGSGSKKVLKGPDEAPDKPRPHVGYTEQEQKKLEQLNKYINTAEELRKTAEKAAKEKSDEQKKEVLDAYNKLKDDYGKHGFGTLPDFKPDKAAKELANELSRIEGDLRKNYNELWERTKQGNGKLTASGLIDTLQLLYGRTIDAQGAKIASGGELIRLPKNPERAVVQCLNPSVRRDLSYKSATVASRADQTIQRIGSSFATDVTIRGAAFVGNGIAAASVSGRYSRAREEESDASGSDSMSNATQIQDVYQFAPQKDIIFNTDDLMLSEAAGKRLAEIDKIKGKERRRKEIVDFYETFGTHLAARSTLGGYYKHHAQATSSSTTERSKLEQTVTNASEWAVSASATYASLYGAYQGGGSTEGGAHCNSGNIKAMSYEANDLKVKIETTVQGGLDSVPVDLWRTSLDFNSLWKVIDVDCGSLFPVWKLIRNTRYRSLAAEFEAVWVQEIFADSLPTEILGDVAEGIHKGKLATAKKLAEYVDSELTAPDLKVNQWLASASTKPSGGAGTQWGVARAKVPEGYKLIGGGARVTWKGAGNLLTASYPVLDEKTKKWVAWEARCKDHVLPGEATIEVWAIGIHDPEDELWEVQIKSERSEEDEHPTVTAQLDGGYVLTCGGAMADWKHAGSLLTASYPEGNSGWTAQCKYLRDREKVVLTAYVIGIKPKTRALAAPTRVFKKTSVAGPTVACSVEVDPDYKLLGGGAQARYKTQGHYLTASYPNEGRNGWEAQSKYHLDDELGQVTAYAIGIPGGKSLRAGAQKGSK